MGSRGLAADSLARHTPSHVVVYQHRSHKDRLDTLHANTLLHNHTLSDREIKTRRHAETGSVVMHHQQILCSPAGCLHAIKSRGAHQIKVVVRKSVGVATARLILAASCCAGGA